MVRKPVELVNKLGLHARAASKLVQVANQFECEIWIVNGHRRASAKSIMGVLMLAAPMGTELILEASGDDEVQALEALSELIAERFGEPE